MTQAPAITQARLAMLALIKSKTNTNTNASKSKSKSGNSSSTDTEPKNKKKGIYIDISSKNQFKRELDQMRRPAYTVRLYGQMI